MMTEMNDPQGHVAGLTEKLKQRLAAEGRMSFADFMASCLYDPEHGYYMTDRQRIGKAGDFFTSSSVHSLFGRLVARQLMQMAELLADERFQVVEQGAGSGHLALDILDTFAAEAPALYERLEYSLVDVSPDHRRRQAELLDAHTARVRWADDQEWTITSGCFLSNELVDALPVHLVEKRDGRLQEIFVTADGNDGVFSEVLDAPSSPAIEEHFAWLGTGPVEGNRAEVNLAAPAWLRQVATRITRGFVVTIDYGYPAEELYAPHRRDGTLMCYRRHQADDNPYEAPGDKDITAHVDFTALQKAGSEAGLDTLWFGEQYRFLLGLGFFEELLQLEAQATDEKDARAVRMTLKNLIMPDAGMGETFKVLVQGNGVGSPELLCARPIQDIPVAGLGMF